MQKAEVYDALYQAAAPKGMHGRQGMPTSVTELAVLFLPALVCKSHSPPVPRPREAGGGHLRSTEGLQAAPLCANWLLASKGDA